MLTAVEQGRAGAVGGMPPASDVIVPLFRSGRRPCPRAEAALSATVLLGSGTYTASSVPDPVDFAGDGSGWGL